MARETLIEKLLRLSESIVEDYYKETFKFPRYETYALADQIRRSLISIPSNLYEGSSRLTSKDKVRFYSFAHGSISEVKYQMRLASRLGYLDKTSHLNFSVRIQELSKLLMALIKSMSK